jgi:hypothetical protein
MILKFAQWPSWRKAAQIGPKRGKSPTSHAQRGRQLQETQLAIGKNQSAATIMAISAV